MGYNLLKSLCIRADEKDYNFDFTKVGCVLSIGWRETFASIPGCYNIYARVSYQSENEEKTIFREERTYTKDVSLILNNSLKCLFKENDFDSFKAFDNVLVCDEYICIFQVDDFSLKLGNELYSIPASTSTFEDRHGFHCSKTSDYGVVGSDFNLFSVIAIALALLRGVSIVYEDNGLYKIAITDKGKAMITKYRMVKGLDKGAFGL